MTTRILSELTLATSSLPSPLVPTKETLVGAFLQSCSPHTLRAYQKDLWDFASFLSVETPESAVGLLLRQDSGKANALVLAYRTDLRQRKLSAATINRRLAALRSMVKLGRVLGLCAFDLEVKNFKAQPYRDTRGPGKEGVKELLSAFVGRTDPKSNRDRAIVRLLYDLALRTHEVCGLDLAHVDLKAETLWILGKGREGRERITLTPKAKDALSAWMKSRGREPGPLFLSLDYASPGMRLSTTSVYRVVRELGEKAGLRARPHGLRHAAITEALEQTGGDVRATARFSRHKDIRVLCVYDDARKDLAGEVARLVSKST